MEINLLARHEAPALGTRATALHLLEKAYVLWEIKIKTGTISTTRKKVAPSGHEVTSNVQIIASLIRARDTSTDRMGQTHFGGFKRSLSVREEAAGH